MLRPFPGLPGPLRRLWCCAALLALLAAPQPAAARPEDGPRVTAMRARLTLQSAGLGQGLRLRSEAGATPADVRWLA